MMHHTCRPAGPAGWLQRTSATLCIHSPAQRTFHPQRGPKDIHAAGVVIAVHGAHIVDHEAGRIDWALGRGSGHKVKASCVPQRERAAGRGERDTRQWRAKAGTQHRMQ